MNTDFNKMNGAELVKVYNALALANGKKPVKRFATTAAGIKRCKELAGPSKGAKPTTTKKAVAEDPRSPIAIEFDTRGNRAKALELFRENYRKMVPRNVVLKTVYGSMNQENIGALTMVLRGIDATIASKKLPYQFKREKNAETKEVSFGLYPK